MLRSSRLLGGALACAFLVGCGRGDQQAANAEDTARNLTLAAPESTTVTGDVAPAGTQTQTKAPAAAPAPRAAAPAPRPAAAQPRSASGRTLAAGTRFHLSVTDTITSRRSKAGDTFTASVVEAVTDASGRVVVPAGSAIQGTIVEVKPAPDPYTPGTLRLALNSLTVGGQSYPIQASIDSLETVREGRGVTAGDAGKVAAGAAAGAVVGRIVGGNARGTVIGGVVGAAVGAGVAHNTKDSDVVLPAGAHIIASLSEALTIASR